MLVKIWLYLTKAVITGDVDEVRVQSEEPNLKSLLLKQAFCFLISGSIARWRCAYRAYLFRRPGKAKPPPGKSRTIEPN